LSNIGYTSCNIITNVCDFFFSKKELTSPNTLTFELLQSCNNQTTDQRTYLGSLVIHKTCWFFNYEFFWKPKTRYIITKSKNHPTLVTTNVGWFLINIDFWTLHTLASLGIGTFKSFHTNLILIFFWNFHTSVVHMTLNNPHWNLQGQRGC